MRFIFRFFSLFLKSYNSKVELRVMVLGFKKNQTPKCKSQTYRFYVNLAKGEASGISRE